MSKIFYNLTKRDINFLYEKYPNAGIVFSEDNDFYNLLDEVGVYARNIENFSNILQIYRNVHSFYIYSLGPHLYGADSDTFWKFEKAYEYVVEDFIQKNNNIYELSNGVIVAIG